ncbi:MAG: CoA-transferase, partial [Bacilli bacterium]
MVKFITKEDAVKLVNNFDTICISGTGGTYSPEGLLNALRKRFLNENVPNNLTLFCGLAPGNLSTDLVGFNLLAERGLIGRVIGSHFGWPYSFSNAISNNMFPAYAIPMGVYTLLLKALIRKEEGVLTTIGLNTFVDPRLDGAKINEAAKREKHTLVDLYKFNNKEMLFYKAIPLKIAFIKGTSADKVGNIYLQNEPFISEVKDIAAAVKNNGGIVICEVENINNNKEIKDIIIHNSLIDYVVISKPQKKLGDYNNGIYFPEINSNSKTDKKFIETLSLNARKICARRALLEIKDESIVNLGVGLPECVANVANEENALNNFTMSVEMGPIGGIPLSGSKFGYSINPESLNTTPETFDLYNGGYLDIAILGMLEVDKSGNVNVSKYGNKVTGPGGFINITQSTQKIIFVGTFSAKGLNINVKNNKLKIIEEGSICKFNKKVEQITFSASLA